MKPYDWKDKQVVITGGSTGIGAAFAKELAQRGAHLVLVARTESRLRAVAAELSGVGHQVIALDLAKPGAAAQLRDELRARKVTADVLINNAGFATYGRFGDTDLATQREEIDLNIGALVELTHVFLADVVAQKGGVIQVASTAAFQPVPYLAVYAATKAFVLSFSEALWGEYRREGVRVLALCPGATDTPFFERVGAEEAALGKRAPAAEVVRVALRAFDRNRSYVIQGFANYIMSHSSRLAPRETTIKLTTRIMQPRQKPLLPAMSESAKP